MQITLRSAQQKQEQILPWRNATWSIASAWTDTVFLTKRQSTTPSTHSRVEQEALKSDKLTGIIYFPYSHVR
jgi:hypothetical protein